MPELMARPTGEQQLSQIQVDAFLQSARSAASTKNPRVLGINQIPLMRAKNGGYPIDMYHPTMEMRQALKEEEEMTLAQMGYQRQYIRKDFPKPLFRRNMEARYQPEYDPATQILMREPWVEERSVRNEKEEKQLRVMKPGKGQSLWFDKITEIPEIQEGPLEDPLITIARLQGENEALKAGKAA